jgi:hypothetical protein
VQNTFFPEAPVGGMKYLAKEREFAKKYLCIANRAFQPFPTHTPTIQDKAKLSSSKLN